MKTRTRDTARALGTWQGMNWIRPVKRLAIYLRDGMACVWCGKGIEQGGVFTLDHLKPHDSGGSNHESNLVMCCKQCNDSRGKRAQSAFARAVAVYLNHGVRAGDILAHVRRASARSLRPHLAHARALLERRGTVAKVIAALNEGGQQ